MKNLYLTSLLLVFLISCQKEETSESEIPLWLEPRIEELENSELCNWYTINRCVYKKKHYFEVVNIGVNCIACEIYDFQGNIIEWGNIDKLDFLKNCTNKSIIWICPDFDSE